MPIQIDLGFTGTRSGMSSPQRASFIRLARLFFGCFHEGDCVGADLEATKMIERVGGYFVHIHPPIAEVYRANYIPKCEHRIWKSRGYVERDLDIVQESDAMIATPKTAKEVRRGSGTWLTIRLSRAEQKPLAILWRDGRISWERWRGLPRIAGKV